MAMSASSNAFDKLSFLQSGALFATADTVFLFWGKTELHDRRPATPALGLTSFFSKDELKWRSYPFFMELTRGEAQQLFCKVDFNLTWQPPDKSSFIEQFAWIEKNLANQNATKVVPVVFEKSLAELSPQQLESLISQGLKHSQGYLYGAWENQSGVLGLTPELLVEQMDEYQWQTMALAGTSEKNAFKANPAIFTQDPKEMGEHLIVVDDIKNQLEPMGEVSVGETGILETPSLVHWLTPIQFSSSNGISLETMVQRLHPTAALGCFPRKNFAMVMEPLEAMEARDYFGSPFAFSENAHRAQVVVMIRGLFWTPGEIKIGSGCGVVKESVREREWQELFNKRQSVKKVFGVL